MKAKYLSGKEVEVDDRSVQEFFDLSDTRWARLVNRDGVEQLFEVREDGSRPAIEETWRAVHGRDEPDDGYIHGGRWTVSATPGHSGWCSDGGYDGYGMTEERAKLAACAPELARLILAVEWEWGYGDRCPWCKNGKEPGHDPACSMLAVLRKAGLR